MKKIILTDVSKIFSKSLLKEKAWNEYYARDRIVEFFEKNYVPNESHWLDIVQSTRKGLVVTIYMNNTSLIQVLFTYDYHDNFKSVEVYSMKAEIVDSQSLKNYINQCIEARMESLHEAIDTIQEELGRYGLSIRDADRVATIIHTLPEEARALARKENLM